MNPNDGGPAITDSVTELEAEVFQLREALAAIVNRCEGSAVRIARTALAKAGAA